MPSLILFMVFLFSFLKDQIIISLPTTTSVYKINPRKNHTYATFSTRLIHRSSPESPFFDPNYTQNDYINDSIHASLARSRYINQWKSDKEYVAAPISNAEFIMKYAIGTPPVERYGILDTGSSFTWFQCLPCINCYDQGKLPLFNPKQSASYRPMHCSDYKCEMAPGHSCPWTEEDSVIKCHFKSYYAEGPTVKGIVSTDTLILSVESDNTVHTLENMVFGCANDNTKMDNFPFPGIVGLGNRSSSLVRQLGVAHFSYFLFAHGSDINGEIHFGPGAQLSASGANTPILPDKDGFYYLQLMGISVDGSDLDLPPGYFDKWLDDDGIRSGIIIDSGITFTTLTSHAFDKLKDAISEEMYMYTQVKNAVNEFLELCFKDYRGGAPELVFQFSGLDYALCESNLWLKDGELHCLAIVRENDKNSKMSILGMYQQRNVQVGYDLEKNLLTLNYPSACPDDEIDFLQN